MLCLGLYCKVGQEERWETRVVEGGTSTGVLFFIPSTAVYLRCKNNRQHLKEKKHNTQEIMDNNNYVIPVLR